MHRRALLQALAGLSLASGSLACENKRAGATTGSASSNKAPRAVVRVSAIPDENPTELMRKYQPLVSFLSDKLDADVKYIPVTDYGAAVQALAANRVDFAWLGAFTFVQASYQAKVEPLCMREVDRTFQTVFVAHVDSHVTSAAELRGKRFAFGSKSSTSGHLMPRHFLTTQHQLDPDKDFDGPAVFSGSHDATVKMVESGQVQAGAVNKLVWERLVRDKKVDVAKVTVVWTTPGYVDYVWAGRTALDGDLRKRFKDAFLALTPTGEHAAVLKLQDAKKFVPASADDFKAVEAVALSTGLLKPMP